MKRLLTYEYGTIKLYENYLLSEINEGVSVPVSAINLIQDIANNHYVDRPFVYISYRRNSYSVDPQVYIEASKIENLIGFAIVSTIPSALKNTSIESLFYKKTFKTFEVISDAKIWANSFVNKHPDKIKL